MLLAISEAGLMLVILLVRLEDLIQSGRVVPLHVEISLLRNERFSLAEFGLCVFLLGKRLPDPLSCGIEVINLPAAAALSNRLASNCSGR